MLILLVGPKGSGKSHVGKLLESRLGVRFFHVEPLWMQFHEDCRDTGRDPEIPDGIAHVHPAIESALRTDAAVCVETTGASTEILDDLLRIGRDHGLLLARIHAPLRICLDRIAKRDPTNQIPMAPEMIAHVFELSARVDLSFDVEIDNVGMSDAEIVEAFRDALAVITDERAQ